MPRRSNGRSWQAPMFTLAKRVAALSLKRLPVMKRRFERKDTVTATGFGVRRRRGISQIGRITRPK